MIRCCGVFCIWFVYFKSPHPSEIHSCLNKRQLYLYLYSVSFNRFPKPQTLTHPAGLTGRTVIKHFYCLTSNWRVFNCLIQFPSEFKYFQKCFLWSHLLQFGFFFLKILSSIPQSNSLKTEDSICWVWIIRLKSLLFVSPEKPNKERETAEQIAKTDCDPSSQQLKLTEVYAP